MRRNTILVFILVLTACIVSACSGGGGSGTQLTQTPEFTSTVPGLEQLDTPEGVDSNLWQEIKDTFAVEYAKAQTQRATAGAPTGEGNRVPDFSITIMPDDQVKFEWSYRNIGDYDQNSEANLADLTQIALNYGKDTTSPTWQAEQVVDGDGNGEINLADITPIAINFLNSVSRYLIETSFAESGEDWEFAFSAPFDTSSIPAGGGFPVFNFIAPITELDRYDYYRCTPYSGPAGVPSGGPAEDYGIPSDSSLFEYSLIPQDVTATQGTTVGTIEVSWTAVPTAEYYRIYRANTEDGMYFERGENQLGETTFSDWMVAEGIHYWYKVETELPSGFSDMSDAAEGWSNSTPDAPQNVQASDGTSGSVITVTWDKSSGATEYNVYRDTEDFLVATPGNVDTWDDNTISDTDSHTYWVSAFSYVMESALSDSDTGFLGTLPTITSVTPEKLYNGVEVTMNATVIGDLPITYAWDFGGGAEPNTSSDLSAVTTVASSGEYSGSLTCTNAAGSDVYPFNIGEPMFTELLIVYNSSIPEDLDLVEYYSSPITGRAIQPEYRLGLPLGEYSATIDRADYELLIRDEVKAFLNTNTDIKNNIKYILLMKGMPHQIPGVDEFSSNSTYSSVDSELCVLYEEAYPIACWLWNDGEMLGYPGTGFHLSGDVDFVPNSFILKDNVNATHHINYLVGRLSAYTYDDAKLMVDRSLAADTSRTGWVIFDSLPTRLAQDTMVDPVWMFNDADPTRDSGEELLVAGGFNVFAEITNEKVTAIFDELPTGAGDNVIGYSSWGKHSGFPMTYILDTLEFTYLPGACFMSYESFNGHAMTTEYGVGRRGQGQICDFIQMGGTVAIGNVYEPFTLGVGDERWVFDRYLNHGDRWIEAAYKGLRMVSWQEVVLGDPLCRVVSP